MDGLARRCAAIARSACALLLEQQLREVHAQSGIGLAENDIALYAMHVDGKLCALLLLRAVLQPSLVARFWCRERDQTLSPFKFQHP
jgi:hypothetical protein